MSIRHVSYFANERTMAFVSIADEKYGTRVFEYGTNFYIEERPIELIKAACLEGGASYSGRIAAVKYQTGQQNKCTVPICPWRGIFAYPTHSYKSFECSWLFISHIKFVTQTANKKATMITFNDGQQIVLEVSRYIIEQQMNKAARCFMIFSEGRQKRVAEQSYSYMSR